MQDVALRPDVYFGLAESYQIRYLAATIRRFKESYPGLHYHITSGDTEQGDRYRTGGMILQGAIYPYGYRSI